MKYSQSISTGLGGMLRQLWAQPQANGTLDAMKVSEGQSTIAKNDAGIGLDNAKTQQLTDQRDMAMSDVIKQGYADLLNDPDPKKRTQATLGLSWLTPNVEQFASANDKFLARNDYEQAVAGGLPALQVYNGGQAAKGGKLFDSVGDSGLVLNQGTGLQGVGNQKQFKTQTGKTLAETEQKNAQANESKASVMLKRAEARLKQQGLSTAGLSVESNGNGGFVVVDKLNATGKPVVMPNTGAPKTETKKTPWSHLPSADANKLKQKLYLRSENELAENREFLLRSRAAINDMRRFGELNREQGSGGVINQIPITLDEQGKEMDAITARLAPNQRPQGSGATSDFDAKMYLKGVPSRDKPAKTNKAIREYAEAQFKALNHELDFKESFLLDNGFLPSRKETEDYVKNMQIVDILGSKNIKTQQDFDRASRDLRQQGFSGQQILTAAEQLGL